MARMRNIKPNFWTNPNVAQCALGAQLLYIGLWNFSDDQGVHPADVVTAHVEVFPGRRDVRLKDVTLWIKQLIEHGLIAVFEHDTCCYWWMTLWGEQTIEKPRFIYPAPPREQRVMKKRSVRMIKIVTEEEM